nr:MAG TPA: hypothetical protein [Caudoviricetes sp.]
MLSNVILFSLNYIHPHKAWNAKLLNFDMFNCHFFYPLFIVYTLILAYRINNVNTF